MNHTEKIRTILSLNNCSYDPTLRQYEGRQLEEEDTALWPDQYSNLTDLLTTFFTTAEEAGIDAYSIRMMIDSDINELWLGVTPSNQAAVSLFLKTAEQFRDDERWTAGSFDFRAEQDGEPWDSFEIDGHHPYSDEKKERLRVEAIASPLAQSLQLSGIDITASRMYDLIVSNAQQEDDVLAQADKAAIDLYEAYLLGQQIAGRMSREVTVEDIANLNKLVTRSESSAGGGYLTAAHLDHPSPAHIPMLMTNLTGWIAKYRLLANRDEAMISAQEYAVGAHYYFMSIRPFQNGNGRTGRLLMNLLLAKSGLSPVIIPPEKQPLYIEAITDCRHDFSAGTSSNIKSLLKLLVPIA